MEKKDHALNLITAAIVTLVLVMLSVFAGDFYFDLNDDVLIKDILSGAYTGVPASHNIQMLYPISAFISALYRINPALDFMGLFLVICQFLCLFLVIARAGSLFDNKLIKVISQICMALVFAGMFLSHLIFVQYTVTCALLSMTAAFLIMTEKKDKVSGFVLPVILIIIAFLIRSEMLLLTLPIVGVGILSAYLLQRAELTPLYEAGIEQSRYSEKRRLFRRYLTLCIAIIACVIISQLAHNIAYSSDEWKKFDALFNARTELYDFQYIPDYEDNKQFYDSIGLSEAEQALLDNYNYGIDDEIDENTLLAVADYAAGLKTDVTPLPASLIRSIFPYLYRLRHISFQKSYEYPMTDAPYNIITIVLYVAAVAVFLTGKKEKRLPGIISVIVLAACRSSLWFYIMVRGRDPIRITHPLYLMEIAVLLGMIYMGCKDRSIVFISPVIAIALISSAFIGNQLQIVTSEMAERDIMRSHYDELYDYFDSNPDAFYFVDVFTAVSASDGDEKTYSEKMFEDVDNSEYNHDYMGGWACKSPLYYDKLRSNGFTSMQDALLLNDVYFVAKKTSDIKWIEAYYLDKGTEITVTQKEVVADRFVIYKVSEK